VLVEDLLVSYMRHGLRGAAKKKNWTWSELHVWNESIDWEAWRALAVVKEAHVLEKEKRVARAGGLSSAARAVRGNSSSSSSSSDEAADDLSSSVEVCAERLLK
jgi:hypothetical protein